MMDRGSTLGGSAYGVHSAVIAQGQTYRKTQLMSLLGVKRTWVAALHMSAFDPKRTLRPQQRECSWLGSLFYAARLQKSSRPSG
jgi:hypothetical protein